MLTSAVGDIHGCADQLDRLSGKIEEHRAGRSRRLVFLGDYIARGPASAGVIERLRLLQANDPDGVVCLTGNHEDMLTHARLDRESFWNWIRNGGDAVLESYGVAHVDELRREDLDWIASLPTLHEDARRYFVHAGLWPGRPIEPENRKARLWIREDFLDAEHDFGTHVVHGHTPLVRGEPDVRRHRTNLDTGCVFGGWLTAGVFTDDQARAVEFLQVQ